MSRFLIVRLGSLGDVVHALPVAAALRRHVREARIDWLIDPRYAELLRLVPAVDRPIPIDPRRDGLALVAAIRGLRRARYAAAIDLQGLLKSAVLARAAGAEETVGFPARHLRERAARLFYTRTPAATGASHVVRLNLTLLEAVGIRDLEPPVFPLRVPRTPVGDAVASRAGGGGWAVLNPGAAWPNKRWPADRFASVARAMRAQLGLRALVLWGPSERPLAGAIVAAADGSAEMAPETTIVELLDLVGRAAVVVSGDTGPLHLAAAVGTPVVALFGPTRAERNGPWDPRDVTLSATAQCECLYERRCRRSDPCLLAIAVDQVVSAVARRVAAGRTREGGA